MYALLHWVSPVLQQATMDPRLCQRLLDTHGQVWVSLFRGHCFFPGSWWAQGFVCALQEFVSPVLCQFWWHSGGVNGDLLQENLCHAQVCCTQSPCPCSRPLLTRTSAGDSNTLKYSSGSVCGVSGSWCAQGLFEPSECLWQVWCLILNVISPLLLSCWVSPLLLDVGYPFVLGSNILVYCYQTLRKWSKAFFSSEAWEVLPLDPGSLDCEREIKILKPKWILPFK